MRSASSPLRAPGLLVALIVMAAVLPTAARGQAIQATVDRNSIGFDEQLQLEIRIEGSQSARPELPEMPEFQVIPRGEQREMQIVNGQMTRAITYRYILVPREVGTFTVGAATVEIEGRPYSSRPFTVTVTEAPSGGESSRDHFLSVRVSDEQPWVGEQVLYTWRFYWRSRPADARLSPLEFGGLQVEDLGEVREYQTTVNGVQYAVSEIRKAVFAQRPGEFVLPASELTLSVPVSSGRRRSMFDQFFGAGQTRALVLRSDPITLEVRPLPPAPTGFSGLVGDFDVRSAVSRDTLAVGESTTLEITVSGTGNVQLIGEPIVPDLDLFKVYDDTPTSSIERGGNQLRGSKVFRKALVPLRPGETTIAPVELIYFDPDTGEYRTASTEPIVLDVRPGEGQEELMLTESVGPTTGKVAVRILADDILPIHRGLDVLDEQGNGGLRGWLWLAAWVLPPIAFGLLWGWSRRRRLGGSEGQVRRRRALRQAQRDLADCNGAEDLRERARACSRTLRRYLGDKMGVEGSALTPIEAEQLLVESGVDAALARRCREVLDRLEAVLYSPASVPTMAPPRIEQLLEELEGGLEQSGSLRRTER